MERAELARLLRVNQEAGPILSGDSQQPVPIQQQPVPYRIAPVTVEEHDPVRFMQAFAQAAALDAPVFLADPAWGHAERAVLAELQARGDPAGDSGRNGRKGWLMIPSGGTGGRLKFARHDEDTIESAVRGWCAHFQVERANCVGVLPLHHVSGLMAWMRAALTGGTYLPWDWKRLEAGDFPTVPGKGWFLSLVPTQLQRLLAPPEASARLRRFDAIFIGGGPIWPDLANQAARAELPISPSYGMTETAAMVAALLPDEFLRGGRSSGKPLPHARIDPTGDGLVRIEGESLFRGYYPAWSDARSFTTEDLGALDEHGRLHILGRRDSIIITGGKKVDPLEIEATLKGSGEFADVAVIGAPDPQWGEALVAFYPGGGRAPDLTRAAASLAALASFKRPRRYVPIQPWPRNAQGKLNRAVLLAALGS